ncbi:MAG: xanthine dehydrogenase accessory protein XdhC, partial [Methylobacteriaceae bacterium]|nr:xanthine dehydrogenase accessory protein XdhC [Methylobacteriaceae bacterium]
ARGSTPREAGAQMLVTTAGSQGTIGGGSLEWHALDVARAMLARGEAERSLDLPLGPTLGQCCGGAVRLAFRRAEPTDIARLETAETDERRRRPPVLVFGAGHTGAALARALAPLPFRVTVVDDRLDEPAPIGLPLLRREDPVAEVEEAEPGSAYVVLTHSHALDYRLVEAALGRGDAAYVGMIGSATKRARFARFWRQGGGSEAALARLACPIGGGEVPDKRPEVIAALTAAELLTAFARYASCKAGREAERWAEARPA